MDQFEEIKKKNKRIITVILATPLLLFLGVLVLFLLYFFPLMTRVRQVGVLRSQIMADQNITPQEADSYIQSLTADEKTSSLLADNLQYNSTLLQLYLKKGDYDKTIEYASAAINRKDQIVYHYYLGLAYFEKRQLDAATIEMTTVGAASVEEIASYSTSEDYLLTAAGTKDKARAMMDIIGFHKFMAADKTAGASEKMQKLGAYMIKFEKDDTIMQLGLTDAEFNDLYFEYYLSHNQYDKILARAPLAIAAKDQASYHYYLGMAYKWTNQYDLALQEMKTSWQADGAERGGQFDSDAATRGKGYVAIFVADDYYNQGDYAKSAEFYRKAFAQSAEIRSSDGTDAQKLVGLDEFYQTVVAKKDDSSLALQQMRAGSSVPIDTDQDGLSNNLENLWGTDLSNKDTDGDGYEDEKELFFGHDPLRPSPDDALTDKDYCNYFRKSLPYFASIFNR